MAKAVAPKITFGTFVAPAAENPYTEVIGQLEEASKTDPNASLTIELAAADAAGEKLKIQRAANAIGRTAKTRHTDTSKATVTGVDKHDQPTYDGVLSLTFTLGERHMARRGQVENVAETPAEEVSA